MELIMKGMTLSVGVFCKDSLIEIANQGVQKWFKRMKKRCEEK